MNDNLLTDSLLPIRTGGKTVAMSLPGVLAALEADRVDDVPFLRPHHRHPWHAFLCQLAVMALEESGETLQTPHDEDSWREMLRQLTPDFPQDEPWRLVVDDLSRPAFLQPPVPEGTLAGFKTGISTPQDLDVLVTSKQHGEKTGLPEREQLEDWVIGLIMHQTFSGYFGSGNYGIARQNKGHTARHGVSLTVAHRPGPNWRRDSTALLAELERLREAAPFAEEGGLRLLWLLPWKGTKDESLPLQKLHPLFLEICRRIRLARTDGVHRALGTGTTAARVDAKEYNGVVGDPWMPVKLDKGGMKAFNSAPHYSVASSVLFDGKTYEPSLLQRIRRDDPETGLAACFRVFQRTEGGSDGYHERIIPIGGKQRDFIGVNKMMAAETAEHMIEKAKKARFNVLKPALLQLMQSARDQVEYGQKETESWAGRYADELDRRIDEAFFPLLWACLELRGDEPLALQHIAPCVDFLRDEARAGFHRACDALPLVGGLRYRALAKAENMLEGLIRKNLRIEE